MNSIHSDLPGKFKIDEKTARITCNIQEGKQIGTSAATQTNHYFPFSLKSTNLKKKIVATI